MITDSVIQTALPIDVPQTKRCTKCGEVKAIDEFYGRKDGQREHRSQCKSCHKVYRDANKNRKSSYKKEYYEKNKNEICAQRKAYYEKNKNEICAQKREYGRTHKDDIKAYRDSRPFENWTRHTLRNHKRKGFDIVISRSDLLDVARKTKHCPICNIELKWGRKENGHIIPESPSLDRKFNGKRISKDNSWVICHRCNSMKSDLPMPEFVAYCKMVADKFGGEYL